MKTFIRALVGLSLLLWLGVSQATIAIGVHNMVSATAVATLTTTGVTTQASGSTCVGFSSTQNSFGAGTVSDSKGNSYIHEQIDVGTTAKLNVWISQNCTGGASHTFTVTPATTQNIAVAFIEITGAAASSLDQNPTATTGSSTTPASPSATTTSANELLLAFFNANGGVTFSAPTNSFTLGDQAGAQTGAWSWEVVSSTGTYSTGVTISVTHTWAGAMLTFIASGGSSCTHNFWASGSTFAVPNGSSGSYWSTTGAFATPNCSTGSYWLSTGATGAN
jgi:hypothetical protein